MGTTPGGLPYPDLDDTPDMSYWQQQLAEAVEARIKGRPRAKMVAGAAQAITTVPAVVDMAGGSITYDTNGMADLANDALVIKTAGYYRLSGRVVFQSNATGYRAILFQKINGGDYLGDLYTAAVSGTVTILTLTTEPILLAVNDVIKLIASSSVAVNLQAANGATRYSHLAAEWVAGQ